MKKKCFALLVLIALIAGCATTSHLETFNNPASRWINSSVIGNVSSTKPSLKDDFFQAVNWEKMQEAAERKKAGTLEPSLFREQMYSMLEDSSSCSYEEDLCKTFYRQIIDEETRNAQGMKGAAEIIRQIDAISSYEELWATAYSDTLPDCLPFYFDFGTVNPKATQQYIPFVHVKYLFGTQLKYDTPDSDKSRRDFQRAKDFYRTLLMKCGWDKGKAVSRIEDAFRFEQMVASLNTDYSEMYTPAVFRVKYPNIPLLDIIQEKGGSFDALYVVSLGAWKNLNKGLTPDNFEAFKMLAILNFLDRYSRYCDMESQTLFYEVRDVFQDEDFYISLPVALDTLYLMQEPMEQAWYVRYSSEKAVADVTELTREIIKRYEHRLEAADWISDYTRKRAFEKLDAITFFIGHATMNDWSAFELYDASVENALLKNAIKIRRQIQAFNIAVCSDINRRDRWWDMFLADMNAFYYPTSNTINICAGLLCDGRYDVEWPVEKKLAVIGSIIGHEITHCFDLNGAQFDRFGSWYQVWDQNDYLELVEKTRAMMPFALENDVVAAREEDNLYYLGEMTADAGAMAVMLDIARDQPDFDYDLFFTSYAAGEFVSVLCDTDEAAFIISTDTHPMWYFRVNSTLQLFDEFYETYGIEEGDGMYRAPEERFKVW